MTLLEEARQGKVTEEIERVAALEHVDSEWLRNRVASGKVVIPANRHRRLEKICGIGAGLKTKVNANIGSSPFNPCPEAEERKLRVAEDAGADTVMDLSTGGDLNEMRQHVARTTRIPLGTVPIYQYMVDYKNSCKPDLGNLMLEYLDQHGKDGVDFVTVHCGVTRQAIESIEEERLTGIVSRGGAFLARWMREMNEENPLYSRFDEVCDVLAQHEMTLSLGDGLRSGCIHDANDRAMIHEMLTLGALARRARAKGVQVMIEGPGHMAVNQIEANVRLQKQVCDGALYYVLGSLVTDIAPGYDHITSAIGGTLAAIAGADYLCYVTPAEHLRLPTLEDVRNGVIASRIAAHAADIVKGIAGASEWDDQMSKARKSFKWEDMFALAIDPETARAMRKESGLSQDEMCTMCGDYCSMRQGTQTARKN